MWVLKRASNTFHNTMLAEPQERCLCKGALFPDHDMYFVSCFASKSCS